MEMEDEVELVEEKPGCGRKLVIGLVVVFFLYIFRKEIGLILGLIYTPVQLILAPFLPLPAVSLPALENIAAAMGYICLNSFGVFFFASLMIAFVSWAAFPVREPRELWEVWKRVASFVFSGERRPVFSVKEGQVVKGLGKKQHLNQGIGRLDANSAMVLETQWIRYPMTGPGAMPARAAQDGISSRYPMARVTGPGLAFVRRGERLRGLVSLRKQIRFNMGVKAYTSEGIEVETHVFALFTLGQHPSIIKVAYAGDVGDEADLRVIEIDEKNNTIKAISDELDDEDKAEIHSFAQWFMAPENVDKEALEAPLAPAENHKEYPPHVVDSERILDAVYSQGREVFEEKDSESTALPPLVATEILRNLLSQVTYDELYLPDRPDEFPLVRQFKPAFVRRVRYQGLISYQFLHRRSGQPLRVGMPVDQRFRLSQVQTLRPTKVLRKRGIKIIHAGFTDLKVNEAVRNQRLENWRASWQQRAASTRADYEVEVALILARERANKQREMILSLSNILQSTTLSEEALTLRVLQALEDAAAEPAARRLLPRDAINMLRSLRLWLLPDDGLGPRLLEDQVAAPDED